MKKFVCSLLGHRKIRLKTSCRQFLGAVLLSIHHPQMHVSPPSLHGPKMSVWLHSALDQRTDPAESQPPFFSPGLIFCHASEQNSWHSLVVSSTSKRVSGTKWFGFAV